MTTRKPQPGTAVISIWVRTFFAAVVILFLAPYASGWLAWVAWLTFAWLVVDLAWSLVAIGRWLNK